MLDTRPDTISSRQDLSKFIAEMRRRLETNPGEWENVDLAAFLEAMAAWVDDMDGYYANRGEPMPDPPTWSTFGEILLAATVYE